MARQARILCDNEKDKRQKDRVRHREKMVDGPTRRHGQRPPAQLSAQRIVERHDCQHQLGEQ